MPSIRFPKSGQPLTHYLEKGKDRTSNTIFQTGAHLIAFAAAVGFYKNEIENDFLPVVGTPMPIDLGIFKSQGLYEILQTIVIAHKNCTEVANNEKEICEIIERFASAGFRQMEAMHNDCEGNFYYRELIQLLGSINKNGMQEHSKKV